MDLRSWTGIEVPDGDGVVCVHVPGALVAPGAVLRFGTGVLAAPTFDQWQELDDAFGMNDGDYETSAPVFFVDVIPRDAVSAERALLETAIRRIAELHRCLLLTTGAPMLDPLASAMYLIDSRVRDERAPSASVSIVLGPAGYELVMFSAGRGHYEFNDQLVGAAAQLLPMLRQALPTEVDQVLDALARTTAPGHTPRTSLVRLVAALEALLVARGEAVTKTFARRLATLVTDVAHHPEATVSWCEALYGVRSDLIHGRAISVARQPEAFEQLAASVRPLSCAVSVRVLRWVQAAPSGDRSAENLRRVLDEAFADPGTYAAVRAAMDG